MFVGLGWPFVILIRLYRLTLSHIVGGQCRFYPTCSRYAEQAFKTHNPLKALWLTIYRLVRCHPLGGSGIDEVPPFGRSRDQ
ncbi:membrane protein insertion efficiency factor YidD [Planctomycetaceae bacterium AH-315-I19]|nr:membrane protein insertion efficiency factor YidD [Planctomycetaceae bacterium AH-315-I19]